MSEEARRLVRGYEKYLHPDDAERMDIHFVRELMSKNGKKLLEQGYITSDDFKDLDVFKLRALVTSNGMQALSEGLITMDDVRSVDVFQLRELLKPRVIQALKEKSTSVETLSRLSSSSIFAFAAKPPVLPVDFQSSLDRYYTEYPECNEHPLRQVLKNALNSNGQQHLDLLCSIDEQERAIRTNAGVRGVIATLHLNALQASSNVDYLFTLGGLALLERYENATAEYQQQVIKALNNYVAPNACADKILEGLHNKIQDAVYGVSPVPFDERVRMVVDKKLQEFGLDAAHTPEDWTQIKAEIKEALRQQVGGLPEFSQVDDFIDYAMDEAVDRYNDASHGLK